MAVTNAPKPAPWCDPPASASLILHHLRQLLVYCMLSGACTVADGFADTEIFFGDAAGVENFSGSALENNTAVFQDVGIVGDRQALTRVLFRKQKGQAAAAQARHE